MWKRVVEIDERVEEGTLLWQLAAYVAEGEVKGCRHLSSA
jgi:hypothetical protein